MFALCEILSEHATFHSEPTYLGWKLISQWFSHRLDINPRLGKKKHGDKKVIANLQKFYNFRMWAH